MPQPVAQFGAKQLRKATVSRASIAGMAVGRDAPKGKGLILATMSVSPRRLVKTRQPSASHRSKATVPRAFIENRPAASSARVNSPLRALKMPQGPVLRQPTNATVPSKLIPIPAPVKPSIRLKGPLTSSTMVEIGPPAPVKTPHRASGKLPRQPKNATVPRALIEGAATQLNGPFSILPNPGFAL